MVRRIACLVALLIACPLLAEVAPRGVVQERSFQFPKTLAGAVIEHDYLVSNTGSAPLRLLKANMTPPLRPTKMPGFIMPGTQAAVRFRLDTSRVAGSYEGEIVLFTDDPAQPEINLTFQGDVVPLVEFDPLAAFFVSTVRGQSKTASVEIINHLSEPLQIPQIDNPSERFAINLETIEPGKRYRLNLTLPGRGVAGKQTETILLHTSSQRYPTLKIQANTLVKERVYVSQDALDFGVIPTNQLRSNPKAAKSLARTLMVYRVGGKNFQVQVQTDVSFLAITAERSQLGDRYQIEIGVIPEKLQFGPVNGSVAITTNDPEFPQLTVPVTAFVADNW